jgi:glutaredoxin
MTCHINNNNVIEWSLNPNHIEELYPYLYDNVEHGGEIILDLNSKSSHKVIKNNTGKADSTESTDSIVNWHSHPINCYNNEGTVWGWPSGEDMRETLIYGLRGSACHIVPSVEGTYTMQPNPCIISGLINIDNSVNPDDYPKLNKHKNWGNFLRGLVVATIEIYFRSTHIFRSIDYMKKFQDISAHDFITFTNIFSLENIFTKQRIKGCSKLGCNQIVKYENQRMSQIPFEKYVFDYESDAYVYYVDKNGESTKSSTKYINALNKGALELLKNLTLGSNCTIPVEKWHTAKVFQLKLYDNKVLYLDKWILYDKLDFVDKVKFLKGNHQKGDIVLNDRDIKFKLFDLKGNCNYTNLKTHMKIYENNIIPHFCKKNKRKSRKRMRSYGRKQKRSKNRSRSIRRSISHSMLPNEIKTVMIVGSTECSHCSDVNKLAKEKKKTHKFRYTFKEYPTIKEAIEKAQKLDLTIDAIPAIFINGKYQEKSPF